MKITELIAALEAFRAEEGDLDVVCQEGDGASETWWYAESVEWVRLSHGPPLAVIETGVQA